MKLELRAGFVGLVPPADRPTDTPPLRLLAVRVREPEPPAGKESLDWLLLTTEGEPPAGNALRVAGWYEKRWLIEEWFRALKTGTRIKDRRLNAADSLCCCLAFDAITACTVMSKDRKVNNPGASARQPAPPRTASPRVASARLYEKRGNARPGKEKPTGPGARSGVRERHHLPPSV